MKTKKMTVEEILDSVRNAPTIEKESTFVDVVKKVFSDAADDVKMIGRAIKAWFTQLHITQLIAMDIDIEDVQTRIDVAKGLIKLENFNSELNSGLIISSKERLIALDIEAALLTQKLKAGKRARGIFGSLLRLPINETEVDASYVKLSILRDQDVETFKTKLTKLERKMMRLEEQPQQVASESMRFVRAKVDTRIKIDELRKQIKSYHKANSLWGNLKFAILGLSKRPKEEIVTSVWKAIGNTTLVSVVAALIAITTIVGWLYFMTWAAPLIVLSFVGIMVGLLTIVLTMAASIVAVIATVSGFQLIFETMSTNMDPTYIFDGKNKTWLKTSSMAIRT